MQVADETCPVNKRRATVALSIARKNRNIGGKNWGFGSFLFIVTILLTFRRIEKCEQVRLRCKLS